MNFLLVFLILVVFPVGWVLAFNRVQRRLSQQRLPGRLELPLFLVFLSYGLLLQGSLAAWAHVGSVFLAVLFMMGIALGTLACPIYACFLYGGRRRSSWNRALFWACLGYAPVALAWVSFYSGWVQASP